MQSFFTTPFISFFNCQGQPLSSTRPLFRPIILRFLPFKPYFSKKSKKLSKTFGQFKNPLYLCNALSEKGRLAQLVQSVCLTSRGSGVPNPSAPTNSETFSHLKQNRIAQAAQSKSGRLAQLVQSVCLTSRGSGVRIPQRPPKKPTVRFITTP